jgi:hypothetical protein
MRSAANGTGSSTRNLDAGRDEDAGGALEFVDEHLRRSAPALDSLSDGVPGRSRLRGPFDRLESVYGPEDDQDSRCRCSACGYRGRRDSRSNRYGCELVRAAGLEWQDTGPGIAPITDFHGYGLDHERREHRERSISRRFSEGSILVAGAGFELPYSSQPGHCGRGSSGSSFRHRPRGFHRDQRLRRPSRRQSRSNHSRPVRYRAADAVARGNADSSATSPESDQSAAVGVLPSLQYDVLGRLWISQLCWPPDIRHQPHQRQ